MSEPDLLKLQKDGANARAFGLSSLDNPYYQSDVMPGNTGEPIEEWNAKMEAWRTGWEMENLMRS